MARQKIDIDPILSHRIKEQRKANKLTQEELADRIGVTAQTIRKYESGKYGVPTASAKAIAEELGCCIEYLWDITDCVTEDEYLAEEAERDAELSKIMPWFKSHMEKMEKQEKITSSMFSEFLGYSVKKVAVLRPVDLSPHSSHVFVLKTPDNREYRFSGREWIEFYSKIYKDMSMVIKANLYEWENAKQ